MALMVLIGCAGSSTSPPTPPAFESVGLVMSGDAHDGGWNQSAYLGLEDLARSGFAVSLRENVAGPGQVAALEGFAQDGFTFIFAHGSEFTDAVRSVSARFPASSFIQINGRESGPNWRSYYFNEREIGYVMGVMAAAGSPSGNLGLILQQNEPDSILETALAGARSVNPAATVTVRKTPDWDTPAFGKSAAEELLALGVDGFIVLVDGAYVGVHEALLTHPDARAYRLRSMPTLVEGQPEVMVGVVLQTGRLMAAGIEDFKRGGMATSETVGFRKQALGLTAFADGYPADARAAVNAAVAAIIDGTLVP